jgi:hypothetical protein
VDDRHPVAQSLHLAQEVRVEEHGRSALAGLADDRPHVAAPDRVESGRGLVQDHQGGIAQQGGGKPEALLHALGEATGAVVGAGVEAGEREDAVDLGSPGARRHARQRGVEREHLSGGQPGLIAEQLGQVADPAAGRPVAQRPPSTGRRRWP